MTAESSRVFLYLLDTLKGKDKSVLQKKFMDMHRALSESHQGSSVAGDEFGKWESYMGEMKQNHRIKTKCTDGKWEILEPSFDPGL